MTQQSPDDTGFPKKEFFAGLDTVRTLLSLGVAVGHYFYWNQTPTLFPESFYLAVDFFFVLSGFVLAQSTLNDSSATTEEFVAAFAIRRVFRLFPLYLVVFALGVLLLGWEFSGNNDPFFYFAVSAVLLQSMGFDAGAQHIFNATSIGIAWSISVELWVGLIFFPAVFVLRRRPVLLAWSCSLVAIACWLVLVNYSPIAMQVNLQRFAGVFTFGSIRGLLGFALGVLVFLIYTALRRSTVRLKMVGVVQFAIVGTVLALYLRNGYPQINDFVAPALFSLLILTIAVKSSVLERLLSAGIWSPIRNLSYGIYLTHPVFMFLWRVLEIPFNHVNCLVYIVLVTGSAYMLFLLVERPGIRLGQRVLKCVRAGRATPTASKT